MKFAALAAILVVAPVLAAACSKPSDPPAAAIDAAPTETATHTQAPAQPYTPPPPPPKLEKPLEIGSQAARDDMYCYGLLIAANDQDPNDLSPVDFGKLQAAQMQAGLLFEAGAAKIVAEKAALYEQTADVSDAWLAVAMKDFKANKPKISLEDCAKRANALPATKP